MTRNKSASKGSPRPAVTPKSVPATKPPKKLASEKKPASKTPRPSRSSTSTASTSASKKAKSSETADVRPRSKSQNLAAAKAKLGQPDRSSSKLAPSLPLPPPLRTRSASSPKGGKPATLSPQENPPVESLAITEELFNSVDGLFDLIDSGDLDAIRNHVQTIRDLRASSAIKTGRPTDVPLEPGQFLITKKVRRRKSSLRSILFDPEYAPRLAKFLEYCEMGVSMNAAGEALGVSSDTIYVWYHRGREAGPKPAKTEALYRRFYRKVHAALQRATIVAEAVIKQDSPLVWLKNGPGRLINEGWAVPEQMQIQVQNNQPDTLAIPQGDLAAALRELRDAGLSDLTQVIDGQFNRITEDGDEFGEDGDQVSLQGTNYGGNGHSTGNNPSLPKLMQPRRPAPIDEALFQASDGQIVRPVGLDSEPEESPTDRLKRLLQIHPDPWRFDTIEPID